VTLSRRQCIFVFFVVPASQQRRFPFNSISLSRRSEAAFGKVLPFNLLALTSRHLSGALVEGLIQAASMPNKMPDRIVGARLWRAMFARWTVISYHGLPPSLRRASTRAHRVHSSGP
jgi:hypothetical protein